MNLSEMLSYADIELLGKIAKHYECDCSSNSKNELMQAILTALNRKETFERQLDQLSSADFLLMNRLLFDKRQYFSIEELTAIVSQADKQHELATITNKPQPQASNPRETIHNFKQRGWLFNGHSHETKYLFQVPEDVKRKFRDCYMRSFSRKLVTIDRPAAYRDEQRIIVQDTRTFLRYVRHNEVALTVDGTMYKRTLQQILSAFHVKEEPIRSRGWRFGYGRKFREYPNRFSLIYDYCYFTGLIEEREQILTLTDKGNRRATQDLGEDPRDIYAVWLKLYKGPIPNLQTIVYWLQLLCKRWTTLTSLFDTLKDLIRPFYFDSPQNILSQRIVQMMMHLGLLQIGEDDEHGTVVRISPFGDRMISGTFVPEEEVIELDNP
jgi:hypothetical protein